MTLEPRIPTRIYCVLQHTIDRKSCDTLCAEDQGSGLWLEQIIASLHKLRCVLQHSES